MQRHLYPKNWEALSLKIRKRSGGRCECEGFCALHRGRRCKERNGKKAKWASGKVALTVAHLTHNPRDSREEYLRAMCQRCHLRYDVLLKNRIRAEKKETKINETYFGGFFQQEERERKQLKERRKIA